jgi:hypothetical protein
MKCLNKEIGVKPWFSYGFPMVFPMPFPENPWLCRVFHGFFHGETRPVSGKCASFQRPSPKSERPQPRLDSTTGMTHWETRMENHPAFPLKMVIFPFKMVIFPFKMVIFPLKMVIFPLKMVIFP